MKVQTLPRGVKKHPRACAALRERVVGPAKVEQHALSFVVSGKNSQQTVYVDCRIPLISRREFQYGCFL